MPLWMFLIVLCFVPFTSQAQVSIKSGSDFQAYFASSLWTNAEKQPAETMQDLRAQMQPDSNWTSWPLEQTLAYGQALFYNGQYVELEKSVPVLISRSLELADSSQIIPVLRLTATVYKIRLRFTESVALFNDILLLYEASNNPTGKAETFIDLAELNRSIYKHDQGLAYIAKALAVHQEHGIPPSMLARLYGREAALYNEGPKDYQKAEQASLLALEQAEKLGDKDLIATSCNELGFIYDRLNELSKSLAYYKRAEAIWDELQYLRNLNNLRMNIARLELKLGNKDESIARGLNVLKTSQQHDWKSLEWAAYEFLSIAYAKTGDFEASGDYLEKTIQTATALQEERHSLELTDALAKHEADLARKELKIATIKNEKAKVEADQRNQQLLMSILLAALLFILSAVIFWAYRSKSKNNQELQLRQAQISQKNEEVEKALAEKEVLLREIHHRVKNNLQIISSLLNLQSNNITDEAALSAFKESQNRLKSIALIHQKLYQTEDLGNVNIQEYTTQLAQFVGSTFRQSGKKIQTSVDAEGILLEIDSAVPVGLIINEMVTNAYKYAFEGLESGTINIALNRLKDGRIELLVSDNGVGLPEGFDIRSAKSMGMKLISILSRQLRGTLTAESKQGSTFRIVFAEVPS